MAFLVVRGEEVEADFVVAFFVVDFFFEVVFFLADGLLVVFAIVAAGFVLTAGEVSELESVSLHGQMIRCNPKTMKKSGQYFENVNSGQTPVVPRKNRIPKPNRMIPIQKFEYLS